MNNSIENKIKIVGDLARASGLTKGIVDGIKIPKDLNSLNRDGLIKGLEEVSILIEKAIKELQI